MVINSQKIAISKHFLISLLFIVLIFTSFGLSIDESYAADLNQTDDGINSDLNFEGKLGNSQENMVTLNSEQSNPVSESQNGQLTAGTTHKLLNGGTFSDINEVIEGASRGDTIKLKGTFYAEREFDEIRFNKELHFVSDSSATLDARGITNIFVLNGGASGSSFKNLILVNGYRDSLGAALHIKTNDVTITNCVFMNNSAYQGGAIYTANSNETARNLLIENCQFIQNHADRSAGAASAFGYNSRVINCTFESNTVYNDRNISPFGGALQIGMDNVFSNGKVYDCKFINNYVKSSTTGSHGGAGCVRDGIEYKNCIFINNSAYQGGALTYHASGLIKNCTFLNNSASAFGGALSTGFLYNTMDLNIVDCIFNGNSAPTGGAIQLIGLNVNISDCIFTGNNASNTGGAINVGADNVIIGKSVFNENVANVDGGAVFIKGNSTLIKDSSFTSNEAIPDKNKLDDGLGGAIYINSTLATVENNEFYFNTARNGSAIYYDKYGTKLKLINNTLYQNQAWVYLLPIYAEDIYYGETEKIRSIIHGGNNIAKYNNLAVSNSIYNAANINSIEIDGETPVLGATTSGKLYQDDREYNMDILMTVVHEDGSVVFNETLNSDCFGEVNDNLANLKVGKYYVTAKHSEDKYYKEITNRTTFSVIPQVDDKVRKTVNSDVINFDDVVIWTLNITNNGPNNATNITVRDVLPDGLIYLDDDSKGEYNDTTGILKIDFLEVGGIFVINIRTTVNKTGNIINKVNVTSNEYDYNLTNNYDQSEINVDSACDLAVVKSVNASVANINDIVNWTITVTNYGPDVATGVVVRDLLPKSLIFIRSNGDYDENSGEWDVGTLNKGSSVSLNITCRVNATGIIENEVSVSGNEYDYDKSNNYYREILRVNDASDLSIVKLVDPKVVNYTDVVKWSLVVSNYGPDLATGVKIYDSLPGGFVYLNSTKPLVDGVIDIGNLTVGGQVVVDIYCRANITGTFVNVASVKGTEFDPNKSNNKANASVYVKPAANLVIEKLVNESTPNFNDLINWTIVVTNYGPDVATGVVVRDLLPKSLIFVRSNGDYDENSGEWDVGTLNKGSSVSLNITCRVNATGVIENEVSVSGIEFDYDLSNNYGSEIIDVDSASDLSIVKLVDPKVVNYTDVVKWSLVVSNYGPDLATGVKIYDSLPGGFVYLNSTKPLVDGVIDIGNLTVGGQVVVDIYCRANITGTFVNVASVKGSEYDPNKNNNKANASIFVKPATDLIVLKSVNNSKPNYGDRIIWTITVYNGGPDDASGVKVYDLLPESLVWIKDTSLGKYNRNSGIWDIGDIGKYETKTLEITTQVNATGITVNDVSVSGNEFDWNKSNNWDSEKINVSKASDLSIVKFANSSTVDYLELVKWTIIVYNNGPDNATGVVVDEILPEGLSLIEYNSSKGVYDNGLWSVCCMESGTNQTLELICRVTKTGRLTNMVHIEGEQYDPNKSNNDYNSSILVPKSSDLSVVKNVDNNNPDFGDIVEWSIVVTNNGPDDSIDIIVIDILPEGLELVSYDSDVGSYDDGIWEIDRLNNGFNASLILRCLVKTLDDVENIVNVVPSQYDWNMSNNKDSESISVNPIADLGIIKSVNVTQANYLNLVKWTIVVTNHGPNDASGVFVSDVVPDGLSIIKVTCDGEYDNSIWNVGDLKNGESKELEIVCKIQATGEFINVANVWGEETDPDWSNNEYEKYLTVNPASDLSITKTVSKYKYSVGNLVSYSIRLTNNGPDDAENIEVNEVMDDSLRLKSVKVSYGDFNKLNDVWSLDALGVGESAFLKIKAIATQSGLAENNVSATSDNFDPDLSNNDDSVSIRVFNTKKQNNVPEIEDYNSYKERINDYSSCVLEKNKSGNPLIVILLSIVLLLGLSCGGKILKKR